MKRNIFKLAACPCMVLAMTALTGCYDTMDDKSSVEGGFEQVVAPSVTITSGEAVDFSSALIKATVSDVSAVLEEGVLFGSSEDLAGAKVYTSAEVASDFTTSVGGLSELSTYYAAAYAYLKDGSTVLSAVQKIETPQAPPFTAALLDGKTYKANNIVDAWGDGNTWNFELKVTLDATDDTKVWITGLCPYAEWWSYNAAKSQVYGIVDAEAMTITIPAYQSIGTYFDAYGFAIFAYDANWNYFDLVLNIIDKGAKLQTTSGYATYASDGYWYDYFGTDPITFE